MKWLCLVLVVIGSGVASACPPGPCLKYRHMQPPPPAIVNTYTRTVRAEPPRFSIARVTAFLTASTWDAFPRGQRLRFVEPSNATRRATPERIVLVREVRQDEDLAIVNVDGTDYALYRCLDADHHYTSCLSRYAAAQ